MKEILSKHELTTITGYTSKKYVAQWLKNHNVPFMISREGSPKVHREALAYSMGVPSTEKPSDNIELDFNHDGFG